MKKRISRVVAFLFSQVMLISSLSLTAYAAVDYDQAADDYYKVVTKDDYDLAPGIVESEIVLNNAAGTHRQVAHVVEADLSNPYVKVLPSYKGMVPTPGEYGVQIMSQQATWAEENGYGNVVAAMNLSLSWYDSAYYSSHPELVGEPLGYMVLNGEVYMNSNGQTSGAQTCVVINFDEKEGVARPADMPKVEIRSTSTAITGWEEQVIPANFGFLVKDGVNQYKVDNNGANGASRSFVGIKEDGTFVMVMNDGRQAPYSTGFTNYEMAEFMLSLGCVQAVNGDGGGSSAFLSQRPGEELKINCSPSDGAERPTTHGILVISSAPATGEFVRASISAENDYYTPGSSVQFNAIGTDLVGTAAEIPADVTWQLSDASMGTINDGLFVSNGKTGTATAQMVYNEKVVGEASVEIVVPTEFSFSQNVMTVPFGKEVTIALSATINGGLHNVCLKPEDVKFTTTNSALGTFNGFKFTSVSSDNAPENLNSTVTATLVHDTTLVTTASLNLGKGSEVLFDFEQESDIDEWKTGVVNGYHTSGFKSEISFANTSDGEVHDGNGAIRLETNGLSAVNVSAGGYAQVPIYLKDGVVVENAISIGFWAYIPDEYENCWIRVLYWYDSDNNGTFDKKNTVTVLNQPEVYETVDESGWRYFSVDVSAYSKILIPGVNDSDDIFPASNHPNKGKEKEPNDYRFIEFMFPHTNTNDLWKTYGSINGPYTIYIDNITADFSNAVDDREAPIFSTVNLVENEKETPLKKNSIVSTTSNFLNVYAKVTENTAKSNATGLNIASAKAYVDGVEVDSTFANGRFSISDIAVANGVHRVKFEISDNMGNKSVVIRLIEVKSSVDASTIQVVPADPNLDRLYGGSVYWMNINATDIETIQSVNTVIDLNSVNHWELDYMKVANGFTAEYTIDEETNTAAITITRTGNNTQTGNVTLASLPIRIIYFDTDMQIAGYTAETFWKTYDFWPQDLKVDVDMGKIVYVDGYTSNVLNAFSNEEFSVDTEMYTSSANMDAKFKEERGTAHVHTVSAIADKEATCTEAGYTERTYCDVCDSVVDWGKITPIGDHEYVVNGNQLVCDCGEVYTKNGLTEIDGKYYFIASGTLFDGWVELNDGWYYFDSTTYSAVETYNNGYVTFEFDKTGKLMSGQWYHNSKGSRYYYGPTYYTGRNASDRWYEIDGKKYCFDSSGYCFKGTRYVHDTADTIYTWYVFDNDGALVEKLDYTGLMNYNGFTYYLEEGVSGYGMFYVDGAYYYCASANCRAAVTNIERICPVTNGLLPVGTYRFGYDGKMVDKNVCNVDGTLYYYELGQISQGSGLFNVDGEDYSIDEDGKVHFTGTLTDASGKTLNYVDGVHNYVPKNGPVGDYFYVNDVIQKAWKMVTYNGDYYFINDYNKLAKNITLYLSEKFVAGQTYPDGSAIEPGLYHFDADGKMVIQNGPVGDYFYVNGVIQKAWKMVTYNGDYYFINDYNKLAKNITLYLSEKFVAGQTYPDGSPMEPGLYRFDADGKMVIQNGPVGDYFYVNGVIQKAWKMVTYNGDYYFINDYDKLAKNITLYLSEKFVAGQTYPDGSPMEPGLYHFDADGKMVVQNGPVGDYFYVNGVVQKAWKMVTYNGDYYFINDYDKLAKNITLYLSEKFVAGQTYPDGSPMEPGLYRFDADGKMILK